MGVCDCMCDSAACLKAVLDRLVLLSYRTARRKPHPGRTEIKRRTEERQNDDRVEGKKR